MATIARAPRSRMAATTRPTMPAVMPGRPACTAPTTPACLSWRSTGTQSATSTPRATPGVRVTTASTSGTGPDHGPSTSTTSLPCTWFISTRLSRGTPTAAATASRLDSTAAGSSPTCPPRLRPAYGPDPRPGDRSVNARSTVRPDPAAERVDRQWNTRPNLRRVLTSLRGDPADLLRARGCVWEREHSTGAT